MERLEDRLQRIKVSCYEIDQKLFHARLFRTLAQPVAFVAVVSLFCSFSFVNLLIMPGKFYDIIQKFIREHVALDLSDVYTWSFPEFVPFCLHLYYFSSFKAFKGITQAR